MKYVFTLLMCIGVAYAQPGSRIVYSNKFIKAPGFIADSNFKPPSDTTNYKTGIATIGSSIYVGNGVKWSTPSGGGSTWGSITGDLDTQTDLYTALNLKLPIADTAAMMKRDTSSAYLIADATTTSTTAVGTNLKFQIGANQRYFVMVDGTASKATSTSGMRLAIGAPSGCTIKGYAQQGTATLSTAMTNSLITAINTLGNTFATGIGVEVPFRLVFTVTNGANAGVIELQFATVTSNTATIFAGTNMRWQRTKGL